MPIRGVLLDLEGVVYQDDTLIAGAPDAIDAIRNRDLAIRFLTNTTTKPRSAIIQDLARMGITVDPNEVFTPARAAGRILDAEGIRHIHLAAMAELEEDFAVFELVASKPDAVVLGDLFADFDWRRLNDLFEMLSGGASLIALHRNRYCRRDGNLALDLGPFVVALEYAARVEAITVGKPSPTFFALAVEDMKLTASGVLMVGDDIDADIGGASSAGIRSAQVRTGKFRPLDEQPGNPKPDFRIDSIVELLAHLPKLQ